MKKNTGFTSFEFYFVMTVIGLIMLIGLQRYYQLAEQTQRFAFEVLAQHFNTAVYNFRARWLIAQAANGGGGKNDILIFEGIRVRYSEEGWPLAADNNISIPAASVTTTAKNASISSCYQLWMTLLQNPAPISFNGGDPYRSRTYHLSIAPHNICRYQLVTDITEEYYFDYSSKTGQIIIHTPPLHPANTTMR